MEDPGDEQSQNVEVDQEHDQIIEIGTVTNDDHEIQIVYEITTNEDGEICNQVICQSQDAVHIVTDQGDNTASYDGCEVIETDGEIEGESTILIQVPAEEEVNEIEDGNQEGLSQPSVEEHDQKNANIEDGTTNSDEAIDHKDSMETASSSQEECKTADSSSSTMVSDQIASTSGLSGSLMKSDMKDNDQGSKTPVEESDDMTEEEAQAILMKALKQISPRIGKDFVLMFKDPTTEKVKEIALDKSKSSGNQDTSSTKSSNTKTDTPRSTKSAPSPSSILKKLELLDKKEQSKKLPDYSCDHCTASFNTVGVLNKHLKLKHGIDVENEATEDDTPKRKRGRPPKTKKVQNDEEEDDDDQRQEAEEENSDKGKRKRGRPPKTKIPSLEEEEDYNEEDSEEEEYEVIEPSDDEYRPAEPVKRKGRGRPPKPKNPFILEEIESNKICGEGETPTGEEVKKRGRGRPPKTPTVKKQSPDDKSTETDEGGSGDHSMKSTPRGRGRPRKGTTPAKEDVEVDDEQNDSRLTKDNVQQKNADKSTKKGVEQVNKKSVSDFPNSDIDSFIRDTKEKILYRLECKVCLLRFPSQFAARNHVLKDHHQNLEQSLRTLDKFPDSNRASPWDSNIYIVKSVGSYEIIPAEAFNTPGRGGRIRTPSKKLLDAMMKDTYFCKICHKKAQNKKGMILHMNKFHSEELPDEDENDDNEEPEEEIEDDIEDENVENDEEDYQPKMEVDEEEIEETKPNIEKKRKISKISAEETKAKKRKQEDMNVTIKVEKVDEDSSNMDDNDPDEIVDANQELEEGNEDNQSDYESKPKLKNPRAARRRKKFVSNRSRSKNFKKIPSYYKYCSHGEDEIETRAHNMPYCKECMRFKCTTCTLTFNNSSHLNRHIRIIHMKEKRYKCDQCDARFTTNESLKYHYKWHIGIKDVQCPYCDQKFLVHKSLQKHCAKHHPDEEPIKRRKKANECEICHSQFSRKERLEYHMLEKHPANNPERECRICGLKFDTDEECFEHSNAHADLKKVPVAKCPHCPMYASSKNNLKRHIDSVHLNIKRYQCTECGKRFKGRDAYIYHMNRHKDPDGRDFQCHICDKKIATEKGLDIHLRIHSGIKPYVCETCGRGFTQKGNMLSHQAIHFDDRPFSCSECNKTFKKKFDLFKHMKRHKIKQVAETGDLTCLEGAGKIYECPVEGCPSLFCSTTDLKLHIRRHNDEKPFECEICFKQFAIKHRLLRHLRNVHSLTVPDANLDIMKTPEFHKKLEIAREEYREKSKRIQTVMIPQPSGEHIEVQIMSGDTEGVEDLLALSNATEFAKTVNIQQQVEQNDGKEQEEIELKIETEESEGGIQIIKVQEDSSGEVQIQTEDDNIVLDPAIIQTLLNSGQQTIYYYVDQ